MPDEPNAGATQVDADASTSSQVDTTTTSEPQAGDDTTTISREEAKKLKSEAINLRKRLKAFEDQQAAADAAKLTEQERLQKQLADAQSSHDGLLEQLVDREVRLQAAELGVTPQNLKHVAKLIWDDLEFDTDTGMPTNVEPLLKDLLKELDLTGGNKRASSGGATNPSRSQANANQGITEDFVKQLLSGALGPDAYAKLTPAQKAQVTDITSRSRYR